MPSLSGRETNAHQRIKVIVYSNDISGQACVLLCLFHISQTKSAVIKETLDAEWVLVMSQRSQETQALLGQVPGPVNLNKPAVPIEF